MSRAFEQAVRWVLSEEGGYVNDPDDPGKETKYGISKRAYPDLDIPNLTVDDAKAIYHRDYWLPCRCDEFQQQIALVLFDSATNQGPDRAIKLLQRALRVEDDGVIGPDTLSAAGRVVPGDLLIEYLGHRALAYAKGKEKFQRGWFNRLFKVQRATWSLS